MALLGMAIFSTIENKKDKYLRETLQSLLATVDFGVHRLILSVNAKTEETEKIIAYYKYLGVVSEVIYNDSNIGTAEAINKVWKLGVPEENKLKMDDDVKHFTKGWLDLLEEAIRRDPSIGIVGCKRKDCVEAPWTEGWYKSQLYMLPHEPGEKWIVGERVNHVMGTCQLYSAALLRKIGYLWQPGVYGFDDSFAAIRSTKAGFINVFLPYIEIDHIDPGDTPFQQWKSEQSDSVWGKYPQLVRDFISGEKDIYYNPF